MAESKANAVNAASSAQTVEKVIRVKPNETVSIPGVDFENLKVEIINGDIILVNPETGEKLIFPGLALFLFDSKETPQIIINGKTITPDMFLAKVGLVGSATEEDYLSFSTLDITAEDQSLAKNQQENQKVIEELEKKIAEAEQKVEQAQSLQQESEMIVAMMSSSEREAEAQEQQEIEEETPRRPPVTEGVPQQEQSDFTSTKTSSSSSSAAAAPAENEAGVSDTSGFFGFKTFLLQAAPSEGTEDVNSTPTKAVYGGGGGSVSISNPSNSAQISTEVIDYSTSNENLVIYADDPALFSPTTAARVVEISANLPDGFYVSSGKISGLPAGFSIEGATLEADGSYSLISTDFTVNDRGDIQMILVYPVPSSQQFNMTISFTASFDPASGVATPLVVVQEHIVIHPVEVKNVSTEADLNYVNADGQLVWVLSNQSNANTILSGSGNDIIQGGQVQDTINAGQGNDTILFSDGNDTIDGGAGSDTVDYAGRSENITVDLSLLVGGYATAQIGSTKYDSLSGIENIHAGSGNDTLIGNSSDNILLGGLGDDILNGGAGTDTLDGGDGNDFVSFINGATSGLLLDLNVVMTGSSLINVGTGVKTLISIENIVATDYNDVIVGSTANNSISGAGGDDSFTANVGTNTYDGGFNGTDTSIADIISYLNATTGISVNLDGAADAQGFFAVTAGAWATDKIKGIEYITGSNYADTITGNSLANILRGEGGNDIINGAGGDDIIYGGAGADNLNGGTGTNTLRFDDLITGGVNFVLSSPNAGTAVNSANTDTFTNFHLYYMSNQADNISTSSGADTIFALDGDDYVYASTGNDVINGGSQVLSDTIDYSGLAAGTSMTTTISNSSTTSFTVTLSGTVSASQTLTNIETIIGTSGNDTFNNGSINQTINGGGGQNTLSYASSNSALTLNMAALSAGYYTISLASGETDRAANIYTLIGSTAADSIRGDSSANRLFGGAGDDTFYGSRGGDYYDGEAGLGDTISYATTTDINRVVVNLSTNSATLTFSDTTTSTDSLNNFENVGATTGNDTVTGNSGDNLITDFGGDDTFVGGGGNDTISYLGITATGVNINLLTGQVDDDLNSVTDDTISGFNNAMGSNQGDIITGNNAANTLNGYGGNDTIYGGQGNDTIYGGDGDDVLLGESGTNILDGGNGTDTASYLSATSGVTANLSTGTATATYAAGAGTDSFTSIEALIGSNQADTITTSATTTSVSTGAGADTIISAISNSLTVLNGGGGVDTLNYSAQSSLVGSLSGTTGSFTRGGFTDSVLDIERFIMGGAADTVTIDTSSIINLLYPNAGSFNLGAGSDVVNITTGGVGNLTTADIDGDTVSNIFRNLEVLDFRSTDLTGADKFDISSAQIVAMTSAAKSLRIIIDGTNIALSDFNISGAFTTSVAGNTTTYSFTDGSAATLQVQQGA